MSDEYDLALEKLSKWEKERKGVDEASISISEMMKEGRPFFMDDDYESAAAKLDRMVRRNSRNTVPLAGEVVQGSQSQQARGVGKLGEAEEEVKKLIIEIEEEIGKVEGRSKPQTAEKSAVQQSEAPHLSLGKMLGGIGNEMAKAVEKKENGKKQDLAGLSEQDQVSALEMLIRELTEKKIEDAEIPGVIDEIQALYSETKTEKQADNEFQRNLAELRNARLSEAMHLLGINA